MNAQHATTKSIVKKIVDGDQGGFVDHVKAAGVGAGVVLIPTALICAAGLTLAVAQEGMRRLVDGNSQAPSVQLKSGSVPLPSTTNWNP